MLIRTYVQSSFDPIEEGHVCTSTVETPTSILAAAGGPTINVEPPLVIWEWNVHVTWAASDLNVFTPPSAPILAASTSQTSPRNQPTPTRSPKPHETASDHASGLSTGEETGIGVGAGIGIILLAVAAFWVLRRRKRAQRVSAPPQVAQITRHELSEKPIYEVQSEPKTAELDPYASRAELEGDWRGYEVHQSPT